MSRTLDDYVGFLRGKAQTAKSDGFTVTEGELHPSLFPHQKDAIRWAAARGKALIAASFGLGKTRMSIELLRLAHLRTGQPVQVPCIAP